MNNQITKEKLNKYIQLTEKALSKIDESKLDEKAKKLLDMSKRYFSDAKHFREKGNLVDAFAAINYAHCFLDAGVLLGFFDVKDNKLFMVD